MAPICWQYASQSVSQPSKRSGEEARPESGGRLAAALIAMKRVSWLEIALLLDGWHGPTSTSHAVSRFLSESRCDVDVDRAFGQQAFCMMG